MGPGGAGFLMLVRVYLNSADRLSGFCPGFCPGLEKEKRTKRERELLVTPSISVGSFPQNKIDLIVRTYGSDTSLGD